MKIFFAGAGIPAKDMLSFKKKVLERGERYGFLNSYWEIKNRDDIKNKFFSYIYSPEYFFLDSGAFSSETIGAKIDIDEYIKFIKKNDFIELYAQLDVIGDEEQTRRNQKYMEERGLNPIPVFQYNSNLDELRKLVDRYDYIALGGLVPLAKKKKIMISWLDACFSIIRDKCKIHGFGVSAIDIWKKYPFYSVDSTSWVTGSKFRRIVEFESGNLIIHSKQDSSQKTVGRYKTIESDYISLNCYNMEQYYKATKFITKLWEKRGVKWE